MLCLAVNEFLTSVKSATLFKLWKGAKSLFSCMVIIK